MSKIYIFLIFLFTNCIAQSAIEIPSIADNSAIIHHAGFTLEYAEKYEQARWVAYMMSKDRTLGLIHRTDNYQPDPFVITGSAALSDYKGSGYDRGHLFPAGDASYDSSAMNDCFYLSNMSPQVTSFNGGVWERLESQVRKWSLGFDTLYVVTAGILHDGLPTIGTNGVAIPEYFYKVVYCNDNKSGIGFIIKNEASSKALISFAVTIDSVENATGIDFFPSLPDSIENRVEKSIDTLTWFNATSLLPFKMYKSNTHHKISTKSTLYDLRGRIVNKSKIRHTQLTISPSGRSLVKDFN